MTDFTVLTNIVWVSLSQQIDNSMWNNTFKAGCLWEHLTQCKKTRTVWEPCNSYSPFPWKTDWQQSRPPAEFPPPGNWEVTSSTGSVRWYFGGMLISLSYPACKVRASVGLTTLCHDLNAKMAACIFRQQRQGYDLDAFNANISSQANITCWDRTWYSFFYIILSWEGERRVEQFTFKITVVKEITRLHFMHILLYHNLITEWRADIW